MSNSNSDSLLTPETPDYDELDIAVVGVAGRFPGAPNVKRFWENLQAGVESISQLTDDQLVRAGVAPEKLGQSDYVRAASVLDDVDKFDAEFFGYSRKEAEIMDPQARLFLECSWHALESAGCDSSRYEGSIGVFGSTSLNTYLLNHVLPTMRRGEFVLEAHNIQSVIGNGHDFLSTRVSYKLNLRGPSMTVQTACSSSLTAIHLARQSLLSGECDLALAGGVSIYLPQCAGYQFKEGMILSQDGRCRSFDRDAGGTIFGRGVGVVVLKPLPNAMRDGDDVFAVIKGSAINNDGSNKVGYTAPGVTGQAAVISDALANAEVSADSIGYLEAHGTATSQGDPIEIAALTQAYRAHTGRSGFCAIGSVKSNIGHLDAAAGVAGFIKAVLMLRNRTLVPSLGYSAPNKDIDFANSPFVVNTECKSWDSTRLRRAAISAMGIGGSNAHVVLEEAPPEARREPAGNGHDERSCRLLKLSAKTPESLNQLVDDYATYLAEEPEVPLADICHTANVGRTDFTHRLAFAAGSKPELRKQLLAHPTSAPTFAGSDSTGPEKPRVAFLFSGQGSQYVNMGRQIYESHPAFRSSMQLCDEILADMLPVSLLSVIYPTTEDRFANERLTQTAFAQPALFALEYSLAQLWRSWGIEPSVVLGHSLGEYVAACVAGVFSLEDGLRLVAERGRLIQSLPGKGAMAAVLASEQRVRDALTEEGGHLSIAAVNGPESVVVSGEKERLEQLIDRLAADSVSVQRLEVSHAFHSTMLEPIQEAFRAAALQVDYQSASMDMVSNVTGAFAAVDQLTNGEYWQLHLFRPVLFLNSIQALARAGYCHFVEIGPHATLLSLARHGGVSSDSLCLPSLRRGRRDWVQLSESLGALFVAGAGVDWERFEGASQRRHVQIPSYPFQRNTYWIDPSGSNGQPSATPGPAAGRCHELLGTRIRSALPQVQFEGQLSAQEPRYLSDHRVFGTHVLPATALLEMVVAAVKQWRGELPSLDNLCIEKALLLPEEGRRLTQLILTPRPDGTAEFAYYSTPTTDAVPGEHDWDRHATGVLHFSSAESPSEEIPLAEARTRCTERLAGAEYYALLRNRGFDYGPEFCGIQHIHYTEGEALARMDSPTGVHPGGGCEFHPAALDAGLQAVFAAVTDPPAGTAWLPVEFERVRILGRLPSQSWSWVRTAQKSSTANPVVDVRLADDQGKVWLAIDGLRLHLAPREAILGPESIAAGLLYKVRWINSEVARDDHVPSPLPNVDGITDSLSNQLDRVKVDCQLADYDALSPELDVVCRSFAISAFRSLGWNPQPGEEVPEEALFQQLEIVERHRAFFGRLLEMLEEDGVLTKNGGQVSVKDLPPDSSASEVCDRLLKTYPRCRAELRMLQRCGSRLPAILRGECEPLDVLFPEGSLTDLENLYQRAPFTQACNSLVQSLLRLAFAERIGGNHRSLRVLEIGAGTGGTTSYVLPVLAGCTKEYLYTDTSPLFLSRAREKFSEYPFVRFELLDIDREPDFQALSSQGAGVRHAPTLGAPDDVGFDLILASNVLHAASDLRRAVGYVKRLLRPGGTVVVVEGIRRQRWVDMVFGMTEGWWSFQDRDLRPSYPLISQSQWIRLFQEAGFAQYGAVLRDDHSVDLFHQSILLARTAELAAAEYSPPNPRDLPPSKSMPTWLIFSDSSGVGAALAARVRQRGWRAVRVAPGPCYLRRSEDEFEVDPMAPEDFRRVLTELDADGAAPEHVLYLWTIDTPRIDPLPGEDVVEQIAAGCTSVTNLTRSLVRGSGNTPRLWLISQNAHDVAAAAAPNRAEQAYLWGLRRVIQLEHPELDCTHVDLPPGEGDEDDDGEHLLFDEVVSGQKEDHVAFRDHRRFVARLQESREPSARAVESSPSEHPPSSLMQGHAGELNSLRIGKLERREPGPGEVEVRVRSSGLNFKDVLIGLGSYPERDAPMGQEFSGDITAVGQGITQFKTGDPVYGLATNCFASHVTTDATFVAKRPIHLGCDEAATLPAAYLTAYYALRHLARLASGERLLIHCAAGGVGLAAVSIAKREGAKIFATAGSEEKREYLRSIGVEHVMDSRSLDFAGQIAKATKGQGVHVVLNSLTGDAIRKNFDALGAGGRYLELTKVGWTSEQVDWERPDVQYFVVDVGSDVHCRPDVLQPVWEKLVGLIANREHDPLPHTLFELEEAPSAFRYMAQAKHIGKLILRQPVDDWKALVRPDASYLITGGLGPLGILTAQWLVEQGACAVALMGRSQPRRAAQQAIDRMRQGGARIEVLRGDVSKEAELAKVLRAIRDTLPPLRGIIHGAGVLDDGILLQQSYARFATVLGPKVGGAWNLHTLTEGMELDFCVYQSSLSSLLGTAGQANHAAANAFMDGLAHARRRLGLKAKSVNWGAWGELGAAVERDLIDRLQAQGIGTIPSRQGLHFLELAIQKEVFRGSQEEAQFGALAIDWAAYFKQNSEIASRGFFDEFRQGLTPAAVRPAPNAKTAPIRAALQAAPVNQRRALLTDFVRVSVGQSLSLSPSEIKRHQSLGDLGLDSLMAVELRSVLGRGLSLERQLPATLLFDYPTVEAIVDHLQHEVLSGGAGVPKTEPNNLDHSFSETDELDQLSEEEAQALLLEELKDSLFET